MRHTTIESICSEYNYPEIICNLLTSFVDVVCHLVNPLSILLIGSTPRGELTWYKRGDYVDLFSDLEFIIFVAKNVSRKAVRDLNNKITEIEGSLKLTNPIFHIDYGIISKKDFSRMRPIIRTYEAKIHGRTLYGQDIRYNIPEVSTANLDIGKTRELILVRLWNMLIFIPSRIVKQKGSNYEEMVFNYIMCRNMLDIPTILLPLLSNVLLSTYKQRVEYIVEKHLHFDWTTSFSENFVECLKYALLVKQGGQSNLPAKKMYHETVDNYLNLIRYLLSIQGATLDQVCSELERKGLDILRGRWVKWAAYERLFFIKQSLASPKELLRNLTWFKIKKREACICILLNMHYSLLNYLGGNYKKAELLLEVASGFQEKLLFRNNDTIKTKSFSERWLYLRRQFVIQLSSILRFPGQYFTKVIDWEYE